MSSERTLPYVGSDQRDETIWHDVTETGSKWIACGPGAFRGRLPEVSTIAEVAFDVSDVELVIAPIGDAGRRLWTELPWQISRLAAAADQDAIVLTRSAPLKQVLNDCSPWHHWSQLSQEKVRILPPVPTEQFDPRLPALAPRRPRLSKWLADALDEFQPDHVESETDVLALKAGLYQVHDELEQSHSYSQSIEGEGKHRNGDYWHAIMHRREPDYGNSKYWFRRVGSQRLFDPLAKLAKSVLDHCDDPQAADWKSRLTNPGWDAFAFVELCEICADREDSPLGIAARRIQWLEMLLLLEQTTRDAIGR